jgi:hypothetical protein
MAALSDMGNNMFAWFKKWFGGKKPKKTVLLDPSLADGPTEIGAAWILYGTTLGMVEGAEETMEAEVMARTALALYWQAQREEGSHHDDYLEELLAVYEADFMREYVWVFLRRPVWAEPPDLRLAEFEQWRQDILPNHAVQTLAACVEPSS